MTLVKRNNSLFPSVWNGIIDSELLDPGFFGISNKNVPINILNQDTHFDIEIAAPGLKKEDFELSLDDYTLTVETKFAEEDGAEKQDSSKKYLRREFNRPAFKRSFTLPKTVDLEKISAKYDQGILFVTIDKKEEAKNQGKRQILIS